MSDDGGSAGAGAARRAPALILVRNTVTHDARIQREARTLTALGYDVLIAGVVSTSVLQRSLQIDGTRVVRLDPSGLLRRVLGPLGSRLQTPGSGPGPGGRGVPTAVSRPSLRLRARRLALTSAYYAQGSALAWRTSPAVVHANDYNTMWIGVAAKLLRRSRLLYDTHELWPDRNGRPEWRPWLLACEALFVRIADAVMTSSPGYAAEIARRYRVPEPVVIRNIPAIAAAPKTALPRRRGEPPVVVYAGGLMPGRGLEQAIRALSEVPGSRLRLVGPGNDPYRSALRRCAEEAGVADRVELLGPVPPDELLTTIADADAGLMLIEPVSASYRLTLPNKLFEYAAAGLPILASEMPVLGGIVRAEGLGEVVAVGDVAQVADGMRRLTDPALNAAVRERVRSFARRETWEREQARLAAAYEGLMEGANEGARVERAYRKYARSDRKRRSWAADNPGNIAIRRELLAVAFEMAGAELRSARAILDAGCGTGWWLEQLAAAPEVRARLHGVDLLPERVTAARSRAPDAAVELGDVRWLPYEDASFDVVSLFTVLSSLSNRDDVSRALQEASRVLVPGGVLLVWEPRVPSPGNRGTLLVTQRLVRAALPGWRLETRATTLLPPLARRLGVRTEELYPRLAMLPALRSHRLMKARATPAPGSSRAAAAGDAPR